MTGSPFTPEEEARIRDIARNATLLTFAVNAVTIVMAVLVGITLVAQWIHA